MADDDFSSPREIARLNIEHYGRLLGRELDPQTRDTVKRLLAQEKAKLAELTRHRSESTDRTLRS